MEQRRLTAALNSDDPAVALRAVGALDRLAEQIEARSVHLARQRGWSWELRVLEVGRPGSTELNPGIPDPMTYGFTRGSTELSSELAGQSMIICARGGT
jgi:hypothetical protein